jgi:hypothetical protein
VLPARATARKYRKSLHSNIYPLSILAGGLRKLAAAPIEPYSLPCLILLDAASADLNAQRSRGILHPVRQKCRSPEGGGAHRGAPAEGF